jgi:hypothetical protein
MMASLIDDIAASLRDFRVLMLCSFDAEGTFERDVLRQAGWRFGVQHGDAWLYPQFQFDHRGEPWPEVAKLLTRSVIVCCSGSSNPMSL